MLYFSATSLHRKEAVYANMLTWVVLLTCLGLLSSEVAAFGRPGTSPNSLREVYSWNYIDYDFGSEYQRQLAIASGRYNHSNCVPIDVDHWRNLTFVTVIRDDGVPSSLNTISNRRGPGGPLLRPYPNWNWARNERCSGITSVYRVAIDKCDRLWVLDTGVIDGRYVCPAQLLSFDLHTSRLLHRLRIPENIARNATTGQGLLVTPVVSTYENNCGIPTIYIADVQGYALIVCDRDGMRRVTSSALDYDPRAENYTIEGQSFQLRDGVVGMDLSERTGNLYFSPMSSFNLGAVNTRACNRLACGNVPFRVQHDILRTQSSAKAISSGGVLFFGLVGNTSIGCWNEATRLTRENIDVVTEDRETLQFVSGMKIRQHRGREELIVLSNRYQKIMTHTINYNEVNFRILAGSVHDLTQRTRCQSADDS